MLIEYSIENFRSIAERTTFSMLPSRERLKSRNMILVENSQRIKKLLKSTIIFGANASGKTNLIISLNIMRNMVISSKNKNSGEKFQEYQPFELDNNHSKKPTLFEIRFIKESTEYHYLFSYNADRILNEELYYYVNKREVPIFKRKHDNFEPFVDHVELNNLFRNTGNNVLFLSKANNEYKKFGPIFEWFNNNLVTIGPMSRIGTQFTIDYMNRSDENKQRVLNFLHHADFDIFNIMGKNILIEADSKTEDLFKNFLFSLTSEVGKKIPNASKVVESKNFKNVLNKVQLGQGSFPELKSIRKKTDGSEIVKDFLAFESSGTIHFFNITGLWLSALREENQILIVDEFDTSLHPDLQNYLIQLFHDPNINKKNSQLIFTSHNTRLLSTDLFRRDQIVFTEKNPKTKSTEIYSLYDYERRQDRSLEKSYFLGRYGGLPDLTYGKI